MMATVELTQRPFLTTTIVVRSSRLHQILLICGILSFALYIATDILGGLRYPGYSFASQAISELAAIGAPSESFVDPLFLTYDLLVLAFSVGVFLVAAQRNRALRIAAIALIGYAAIGGAAGLVDVITRGQISLAMSQRGAGSLTSDAPHIVLTGVLVLFLIVAMVFGAFALGRRFRIYSQASLAIVLVFGALTARNAGQLAAGQPTPGMGILERIDVYSAVLWIAVLATALLQRPRLSARGAGA